MKKILFLVLVLAFSTTLFAAKIDLAISSSDVTISPQQPTSSDSVSVTVKVHNLGSKTSKASIVKLKVTKGTNKVFNQKNSIPAIIAGDFTNISFSVGKLNEGNYTLLIKVDPANAIPETNEGNNKITLTLTVAGGGGGDNVSAVVANVVATTLSSSLGTMSNIGTGESTQTEFLLSKVYEFYNIAKHPEDTQSCGKSGSVEFNYYLDSTQLRIAKLEFNYNNCQEWDDESQNSYTNVNGATTIELSYLSDNVTSPDFNKISQMIIKCGDGNPSSDTKPDYSVSYYENGNLYDTYVSDYTLTVGICDYDDSGMPTCMGIYVNGESDYSNPVSGVNYKTTFNNLHYDTSITGSDNDMTISMTIAGTCTTVYDNNQSKKISVTYNNVTVTAHITDTYEEDTMVGLMDVVSPCYTGSISVETIVPIYQSYNAQCPSEGKLKATTGGKSAYVIFNSDGSISIDLDCNGSIDSTIQNCNDIFKYPC